MPIKLSFVIPAYNEEAVITTTLSAISHYCCLANITHEIIVINNDSTDKTEEIAKKYTPKVYNIKEGSIGSLRNIGAAKAEHATIVFLDADISLTEHWSKHITNQLSNIDQKVIAGSHCSAPDNNSLINKYWFNSFQADSRDTHLGSAHLIISKSNFFKLGGFDETLITGEDYEFCQRAQKNGFELLCNQQLVVIHNDFPENILDFTVREWWHGTGDRKNIFGSKIAIASLCFITLHLLLITTLLTHFNPFLILAAILLLIISFSFYKFRQTNIKTIAINSFISYFYFVGRSLSLICPREKKVN